MSALLTSTNSDSPKQSDTLHSASGSSKYSAEEQSLNIGHISSSKSEDITTNSQSKPGLRAAEAFVRPHPLYTDGDLIQFGFDLKQCLFSLKLESDSSSKQGAPTEIFLPDFHFPPDLMEVETSGGKWKLKTIGSQSGPYHVLEWWHAEGIQDIKIKGSLRQESLTTSIFDICRQGSCIMM